MAPNTPRGVSRITMSVYLNITWATPSKNWSTISPRSPARVRLTPKSVAKTTTGRMSPSAACLIRLEGNRCSATSQPEGGLARFSAWATSLSGSPSPGRRVLATTSPMNSARVVTTSK